MKTMKKKRKLMIMKELNQQINQRQHYLKQKLEKPPLVVGAGEVDMRRKQFDTIASLIDIPCSRRADGAVSLRLIRRLPSGARARRLRGGAQRFSTPDAAPRPTQRCDRRPRRLYAGDPRLRHGNPIDGWTVRRLDGWTVRRLIYGAMTNRQTV